MYHLSGVGNSFTQNNMGKSYSIKQMNQLGSSIHSNSKYSISSDAFNFQTLLNALCFSCEIIKASIKNVYNGIHQASILTRNTQEMSNRVDEVIAEAAKGDDKTKLPLPDDVIKYMNENNILVDGCRIDVYLSKYGPALDKGKLQAVKAALDNAASRGTDMSSELQLNLTELTQNYSNNITLRNAIMTAMNDLKKAINSSIRG
ncbi:MAG: hypothetical protein ACRCZ4_01900 [Plesiomonas sp.]|uniref:hypothetical protein n=1 Tax=Plesiomonas sp. TaxID=2486279 RepID=UPI003F3443E1